MFAWVAMQMDRFLTRVVDEVWDISEKINEGRDFFGLYRANSKIVPLSYPPSYFRFKDDVVKNCVAFVGLDPYGLELMRGVEGAKLVWLGGKDHWPLEKLLEALSVCGIGLSLWKEDGNNYYGDPGKTKLYSACGLPVIMTNNTVYSKIIQETQAGIVIDYNKASLQSAIQQLLNNYDFYKSNVKKTWPYINSDEVFKQEAE
jgi:glycosyltransferase involved in cell wall biosynthesis